jgi:hypothetical protein
MFLFYALEPVCFENGVAFPLFETVVEFFGVETIGAGRHEKQQRIIRLVSRIFPCPAGRTEISVTTGFGIGSNLDCLKFVYRLADWTLDFCQKKR